MKTTTGADSVFDGFVSKGHGCAPKAIARNVEAIDLAIYAAIDHARFRIAKRRLVKNAAAMTYSMAGEPPVAREPYEEGAKWAIGASKMRDGTRKIINGIRYGGGC